MWHEAEYKEHEDRTYYSVITDLARQAYQPLHHADVPQIMNTSTAAGNQAFKTLCSV